MATVQDKRQDFLWIVGLLMRRYTDVIGWSGFVGDAVAASYRIPKAMTARDAALDFWGFFCEEFGGEDRTCPNWMSNLRDPTYA